MSYNKQVLLRERKRHTARRVSSAYYAGEGVPCPRSGGGSTPSQVRGVPHPRSGGGYPVPGPGGTPSQVQGEGVPHPDLVRGVPQVTPPARPGMGYPPARSGMGYPPQTWDRVPPHPNNGEQTDIPKYKYYLPSYYVRGR